MCFFKTLSNADQMIRLFTEDGSWSLLHAWLDRWLVIARYNFNMHFDFGYYSYQNKSINMCYNAKPIDGPSRPHDVRLDKTFSQSGKSTIARETDDEEELSVSII